MKAKIYVSTMIGKDWAATHIYATEKERFEDLFNSLVSECWEHLDNYPSIGCPVFEDENGETIELGEDLSDEEKQQAIDYYYLKANDEECDFTTEIVENPEVVE